MIKTYQIKKIPIKDIQFDLANPNKMSDEQIQALRYSLKKFGQLKPPVVDQDFIVCDGEHQLRAYMLEGIEEIEVIQIECTPMQRKLIRQTMNKLRGVHDPDMDSEELKLLLDNNSLDELSKLLAVNENELKELINKFIPTEKPDKMEMDQTSKFVKCPECGYEFNP